MDNLSLNSICVYCGSADGLDEVYLEAARRMGSLLARSGIRLVYGAGKTGLMGAVADGALEAGGKVVGVTPVSLNLPALIHAGLSELQVTPDIHSRKARMSALADAFIALPGGFGTFEELFETLTWAQIGLHSKPIGLLNINHYYDPLVSMVEHAIQEGFIYPEQRGLLMQAPDPLQILERLRAYTPPDGLSRWITREK
ncbi:MAG TPA: TIGR00730 family Rossman fold protein [Anaerolinea sp.]|nr:TIGR00730 family Rossman fold protein [Anaerolinea sp.]